ncbi:MAG: ATP-binding protein [Salinirussus sp.]
MSDGGSGIPEAELDPVRSGAETDLQHGSGLGLWVVQWGTELLGSEIDFDTGPEGTTVSLTVPDRGDPAPE